jgi:hypothetical protein
LSDTDIQTYDLDTETLIGDKGIVSPDETHEKPFEQWKLADWIENMKIWPGLPKDLGLKKVKTGVVKLAEYKNAQYKALSTQIEYHLLHKRELESQIYSEPLLFSMPQTNLMLASHRYITQDFWPRLGHIWKELCPDPDFLWGLFEYSFCYNSFYNRLECGRESKKALEAKLGNAIQTTQTWLEDPWMPKKKLQSSAIRDVAAKLARDPNSDPWLKALKEIKEDPNRHFYKLLFIHSEMYILYEPEFETLIEPYRDYAVHAWSRYLKESSQSQSSGVWYLESLDYEPMWSGKVGRPPKPRQIPPKTKSQNRRGPAIGSKQKLCNGL